MGAASSEGRGQADPAPAPQYGERVDSAALVGCYKHPRSVTFTLCHRCARPICSQCQHPIPVGVICSDCVRGASPQRARRSSAFRVPSQSHRPIITLTLIGICIAVWIAQALSINTVTRAFWYAPLYSLPQTFEPWRLITSIFTHSPQNFLHILFNMYSLWVFGRELEHALGRLKFLGLYLLAGLGGSVAVQMWGYTSIEAMRTPTVGASGAIFGILAASIIVYRRHNVPLSELSAFFTLLGINLLIGFLPGTSISWQAHLGGAIIGGFLCWIITARSVNTKPRVFACFLAVALFLLALSSLFWIIDPRLIFSA